jgi:hypothetical protein
VFAIITHMVLTDCLLCYVYVTDVSSRHHTVCVVGGEGIQISEVSLCACQNAGALAKMPMHWPKCNCIGQITSALTAHTPMPRPQSAALCSAATQWPEIGTWYFQLVLNAQYLGKFCAYALLPVWQPKHPRTILLATSVANLTLFVSAFGAAAKFKAGPVAYVLLMFFFSMSHG